MFAVILALGCSGLGASTSRAKEPTVALFESREVNCDDSNRTIDIGDAHALWVAYECTEPNGCHPSRVGHAENASQDGSEINLSCESSVSTHMVVRWVTVE